jgi:cellulose synthase/poly-beta-1,6-N-acetylglucosamine synthase-like glycosyltransferase
LRKISFLVVIHNDQRTIKNCLESITKQTYPNKEIVIVDANSIDDSVKIAEKYTNQIILLKSNVLGKSRQISVDSSHGELLAIMDADVILPPGWAAEAVSTFVDNVGIAWSFNEAPKNSSIVARAFFNYWKESLSDRIKKSKGPIAGSNSMYLRKAVEEVGGFDTKSHYSEDIDLGCRVSDAGYKIAILSTPIIHDTMNSLSKFTRNQLWAASDFSNNGLNRSRLSSSDIVYEHLCIGTNGFLRGIFKNRDKSWAIYPLLLSIRTLAYCIVFSKRNVSALLKGPNNCFSR